MKKSFRLLGIGEGVSRTSDGRKAAARLPQSKGVSSDMRRESSSTSCGTFEPRDGALAGDEEVEEEASVVAAEAYGTAQGESTGAEVAPPD